MRQNPQQNMVDVDIEGPLTVTITSAAAALNLSPRQVYRMIDAGVLESRKFGRAHRVTTRSVRRAGHGDAEQT
jgi:excisionase family DNA binding protein